MTETQQAQQALHFWERRIGQVAGVEAAPHAQPGEAVTAFAVTTARGERFILKDIAGSLNADRIDAEYDLLAHLQAHGVPVAVPIPSDSGPLGVDADEGGRYVLYPMLPADHTVPPADIARVYAHIGAAVGRLHKALAAYTGEVDSWTMDLPYTVYEEASPRIMRALHALSAQDAARFRDAIAAIEEEMRSALRDLPAQRIHGDCHGGNYLLYRGDVSGFVDLDHLPVGPRVYDIGYLLADMAKAQFFDIHAHRDWLAHFDQVIAGYEQENSLSRREKDALWFVMLATQVLFVDWFFQHQRDELARKNLEAFYWIYRHREAIAGRAVAGSMGPAGGFHDPSGDGGDRLPGTEGRTMTRIETDRLVLRNFSAEDWPDLHEMIIQYQASEVAQYDHPWPTGADEIRGVAEWFASGDTYLAVCLKATGKAIGFVCLNPKEGEEERAFGLGYVFHADYHGRGYATEGCRAMLDRAFGALGAERVVTGTAAANAPSCRLLQRLGLKEVGRSTGSFRKTAEGTPIAFEGISFAITRAEWRGKEDMP